MDDQLIFQWVAWLGLPQSDFMRTCLGVKVSVVNNSISNVRYRYRVERISLGSY